MQNIWIKINPYLLFNQQMNPNQRANPNVINQAQSHCEKSADINAQPIFYSSNYPSHASYVLSIFSFPFPLPLPKFLYSPLPNPGSKKKDAKLKLYLFGHNIRSAKSPYPWSPQAVRPFDGKRKQYKHYKKAVRHSWFIYLKIRIYAPYMQSELRLCRRMFS